MPVRFDESVVLDLRRMKVISFFSAKGGTGKTTFNVLLASYIQYRLGKRVMVLDFDYPEFNLAHMRERDLLYLEREGIPFKEEDFYPIERVRKKKAQDIRALAKQFELFSTELDYLILDFPGSFSAEDPVCQLLLDGRIDLIVIPVELDPMVIASMRTLSHLMQEYHQRTRLFFNRVGGRESKDAYACVRDWFAEDGSVISEHFVKQSESMKKEKDSTAHIRSTVDFPVAYARKRNPGIVRMFDEVLEYVEGIEKKAPAVGA